MREHKEHQEQGEHSYFPGVLEDTGQVEGNQAGLHTH